MSTTYFLAGSSFLILSIVWFIIKHFSDKEKDNEQAKKDIDAAIEARDWDALDDARSRLR